MTELNANKINEAVRLLEDVRRLARTLEQALAELTREFNERAAKVTREINEARDKHAALRKHLDKLVKGEESEVPKTARLDWCQKSPDDCLQTDGHEGSCSTLM